MRFSGARTITIAAGPAIPADDAVDPSASAVNAGKADLRLNLIPAGRDESYGQTFGVLFTPRVRQADGSLRAGGTVTYTLWERDETSGDYWLLAGSATYTEGTTQPVLLASLPPGQRIFMRATAIGGGVAATDVITGYVAVR